MSDSHPEIRTLYLLPHSHTDIGYSHDPVVTLELHDRFIDRAIRLCEQTREYPLPARFRWTVEVFSSVLHWWENRGASDHQRLKLCLERGEIDIGARYLVGTELYAPEDIEWEIQELERMRDMTGFCPKVAIQNDVNGFPLACARKLQEAGVGSVMMALNTTMGHSPFARCSAFEWDLGDGRNLFAWNGWIYNRIKSFCHLNDLADKFHESADAFLAGLPDEYPYDFAVTSGTIGDNVGPFVNLPEEVRKFNERSDGIRLKIATFSEVVDRLRAADVELPTRAGHWPDFWTFGAGSVPQMVGMVRRAQRRLRLVKAFRCRGWAEESGGTLTVEDARRDIAYACEHTFDSHSSAGESCGSPDALRQKAQIQFRAAAAESSSMALLRDHLAAMAEDQPRGCLSVLVANPHEWGLKFDYLMEEEGTRKFATSRQPEHLFQFDREPTVEALADNAEFGVRDIEVAPEEMSCRPMESQPAAETEHHSPDAFPLDLESGDDSLTLDESACPVSWQPVTGEECLDMESPFAPFQLIHEQPTCSFQDSEGEVMDPVDTAWNPDLEFSRRPVAGSIDVVERRQNGRRHALRVDYDHALLRRMTYRLDERYPGSLEVTGELHLSADSTRRAYYLPLPLQLSGTAPVDYWTDNCGTWFRAEDDQLPGTCNSFYHGYRGAAVSRESRTIYVMSPDVPLFQFGGLTFGQLPSVPLQRKRPFIAVWLYNNYWGTNFPSYSPGQFRFRLLLHYSPEEFDESIARRLDARFDTDFITHPVG